MTDTDKHWSTALATLQTCHAAMAWARTQSSLEAAWAGCERGDWMLWLLGKTCAGRPWSGARKPLMRAACACARLALPFAKDPRILAAIGTAERWCDGMATPTQVKAAAAAADAAASAASAASAATAATAARSKALKECAAIVRQHFPIPPTLGERRPDGSRGTSDCAFRRLRGRVDHVLGLWRRRRRA